MGDKLTFIDSVQSLHHAVTPAMWPASLFREELKRGASFVDLGLRSLGGDEFR